MLNLLLLSSSKRSVCPLLLLCACSALPARCQEPAPSAATPAQKSPEVSERAPELPAQIELLETHVRFESDGDSRKEVHARVHINNEFGAREFARLALDYNRSFQQVEFPLVRVTHAGGGTADILPSAISDQPNPAVVNAPAYQDVRVKSVRILGLAPNDLLEYRVVTTTTNHPLAPDFWLDHTFDRSGVVSNEIFELDLPRSRFDDNVKSNSHASTSGDLDDVLRDNEPHSGTIYVSPETPATSKEETGDGAAARLQYKWVRTPSALTASHASPQDDSDVVLTTYRSWNEFAHALAARLYGVRRFRYYPEIFRMSQELRNKNGLTTNESVYAFVSQKIRTVQLPLGATGFRTRDAAEIVSSGYGNSEDKAALFALLVDRATVQLDLVTTTSDWKMLQLPRPSHFSELLVQLGTGSRSTYLDPNFEVAPFGAIPGNLRGHEVLMLYDPVLTNHVIGPGPSFAHLWQRLPTDLPFKSSQSVGVEATVRADGMLSARVKYRMRGDNELLLRLAFHQAPKEKWKDLAQLLALSDGFRGKITNVTASDPAETTTPFTVEYEITQPKFADWTKKPVRIPALLPQLGMPDPPTAKAATGAATATIELGTPLDVETHLTLHLPAGSVARMPTGTGVVRDYATFTSKYAASGVTVTAWRHLNFLQRAIPGERVADYNAFLRAVQNDEAQEFTLERREPAAAQPPPKNSKEKN